MLYYQRLLHQNQAKRCHLDHGQNGVVFERILLQWWNHYFCRQSCWFAWYSCFWHQDCQCLRGITCCELWCDSITRLYNFHCLVTSELNSSFCYWRYRSWSPNSRCCRICFCRCWRWFFRWTCSSSNLNRFRWYSICWRLRPNRYHHNCHQQSHRQNLYWKNGILIYPIMS